jgi:hypothetical protein
MRRYLQGTLDFACAIYAVINALACTRGLNLADARKIYGETSLALSGRPALWSAFLRNHTDHYWLVRYMVGRWCVDPPHRLRPVQPFSSCLLPGGKLSELTGADLYLPEKESPAGPSSLAFADREARAIWDAAVAWFGRESGAAEKRTAVLRFHRFLPGVAAPVVSHWTTALRLERDALSLHDASSESGALLALEKDVLVPGPGARALVRIVPESLLLLQADDTA